MKQIKPKQIKTYQLEPPGLPGFMWGHQTPVIAPRIGDIGRIVIRSVVWELKL